MRELKALPAEKAVEQANIFKNVLNKTIISKAAQQPKKGDKYFLKNDEQDYFVQQREPKTLLVNGRR